VRGVELVSWSGELIYDDVAEVGKIFEAFAKDFGCADAVCDVLGSVLRRLDMKWRDLPHVWIRKCRTASEGWGIE
jgi:hypothetical protein